MTPIARLTARKEFKEMWRDARLLWAVAVVMGLVLTASLGSWRHYQTLEQEKAQVTEAEHLRWLNQGSKNPHAAAHYGIYTFKPQTLLAAFEPGIEEFVGVSVWLEAHKQNPFVYRSAQDAAPMQRFSQLTPASAVRFLGPLIIIFLGFNAFAGEREQGTLQQLLSLGIDGRHLFFGKAAAISGVLLVTLGPAILVAVIAGMMAELAVPWLRLLLLTLAYLLYLGAFLWFTLAVSAWAHSARSALVILLSFWVLNCFLAPRAVAELVDLLYPLPTAVEWQNAMQAEVRDGHSAVEVEMEIKADLINRYGVKEQELPVNWRGIFLQRGEEQNYPIFDRHFGQLFYRICLQDYVYQWGSVVAPLLALQPLSMGLAGTDFEHHRRFVTAAESHRRVIQKIVNDDLTLHPEKDWAKYQASAELWARVPEFRYTPPSFGSLMQHYVPAAVLLTGWFLTTLWMALRATQTLKP